MSNDDTDYVPQGLTKLPKTSNVVNTRGRNKKIEEKSESEGEKDKDDEVEGDKETLNGDDDDEEMSKFFAFIHFQIVFIVIFMSGSYNYR